MGKYINENLIKEEEIVHETKYHWIIFLSPINWVTLFIPGLIMYNFSEFGITNKRLIIKTGLISRKTIEMNLSKIESVNVDQGILGRILGYGTIRVMGTGGTKESFIQIANPIEFRKRFQEVSI